MVTYVALTLIRSLGVDTHSISMATMASFAALIDVWSIKEEQNQNILMKTTRMERFSTCYYCYRLRRWRQTTFPVFPRLASPSSDLLLTLSQPRGGGHTISNISRTLWATDLKLSDNLNELIFKTKIDFSTASTHPWLPQQRPKLAHVYENTLGSFHAKVHQNWTCFCYFHEDCHKCSLLRKFGLDIPFHGVLVTVFVSHSFSCFNDLEVSRDTFHFPWKRTFSFFSL